jgi:hypothetical protein
MPKRKSKAKDIVARSLSLVDSKGKTRIFMGVFDKGHAQISVYGARNRAIDISADNEGGIYISLQDDSGKSALGLGISADDQIGISVLDHSSGGRIRLGSDGKGKSPEIALFHNGKLHWSTQK